ncbi:YheC/YheD family endospore coat-associated protein [Rossellomorea aquimaris]|uniref:YheC/YheD family endospore coat-associated protein n=1 Tax=Rossellomorea aquimaris TaxID=189382 RepID=UPI0005CA2B7D|nr:YheC/YheD family protein [Rossellomorea aquimaris]
MDEQPIGILLSTKQWNNIIRHHKEESYCLHYVQKAEELGDKVVFFTLDHLSLRNDQVKSFEYRNGQLIERGTLKIPQVIYNPTKYNKKKSINKLRELIQKNKIKMINEHHVIRQKRLLKIIESNPSLKGISNKEVGSNPPFFIKIVCQKRKEHKWRTPFLYVKDMDGDLYTLEELHSITGSFSLSSIKEQVNNLSHSILDLIQYYYPGIYELGLQYRMNMKGQLKIDSTDTIHSIIKDLQIWNPEICKEIVQYPLELAHSYQHHSEFINPDAIIEKDSTIKQLSKEKGKGNEVIWVKFIEMDGESPVIKLPQHLYNKGFGGLTVLKFGVNEETIKFIPYDDFTMIRENTYNNPIELFISSNLIKKMHIPLDMVYQMSARQNGVQIGPLIGFLLGNKNQTYHLNYMEKFKDRLGLYESFGGTVIAFSARSINWEENIAYGMVYDPSEKVWRYGSTSIPSVIYRRNFHQDKHTIEKLKILTNNQLFNSHHFTKSDLTQMQDEPQLKRHLPSTYLLQDLEEMIRFVKEKNKIILKPVSLSRGRGIFILEYKSEVFYLHESSNKLKLCHSISTPQGLYDKLVELNVFSYPYLYQTYIDLLKIEGRPFDVRVVMQKTEEDKWICSGIECRVAGINEELTNIARGGKALHLKEALDDSNAPLSYSYAHKAIVDLCQRFCALMDQKDEHYAEFGLDIALDYRTYPWILEANIFPSFKGFKKMDYDTYLAIRYQPLFYAVHLQGFQVVQPRT